MLIRITRLEGTDKETYQIRLFGIKDSKPVDTALEILFYSLADATAYAERLKRTIADSGAWVGITDTPVTDIVDNLSRWR